MVTLKCKMCGGDLAIDENSSVCECEYCGSRQTVPKVDDEKKITLFSRANRLRFACEFDKAYSVYENIVSEFPEEAEAFWGLLLCKYGIEYVDDPKTGKKIPTCHRSSYESIMDDDSFEQVMECSDSISRSLYREEAKAIEELRKSILEVSSKEEPYDVFICYKETDQSGERTIDSVIAQDVYDLLVEKGYRVFFSRISLEDKLGMEYEPFIFAALNSAKLMLAFGTSYDNYNAVWVKNEWSRFLKLMVTDKSKHLIPCYREIDAYDMPQEFRHLQAQDMGKVGAIQDLLRGVDKILGRKNEIQSQLSQFTPDIQETDGDKKRITSLLERGKMALEDGEFEEAKNFYNDILNRDAKCAEAYLGLCMAKEKCNSIVSFGHKIVNGLVLDNNYNRAKQFASEELRKQLEKYEEENKNRVREKDDEVRVLKDQISKIEKGEYDDFLYTQQSYQILKDKVTSTKEKYEDARASLSALPEYNELNKLEQNISEKKEYLSKLGLFSVKEKSICKKEIEELESEYRIRYERVEEEKKRVEALNNEYVSSKKNFEEYIDRTVSNERERLENRLETIELAKKMERIKIGDTIKFGKYDWIVLDEDSRRFLLLSKYCYSGKYQSAHRYDGIKYNNIEKETTWEKCSLRRWLNSVFLSDSFSLSEQMLIANTNIINQDNRVYSTPGGNNTIDKIFILSMEETIEYFPTEQDRKFTRVNGDPVWTWLRTPGEGNYSAVTLDSDGSIDDDGCTFFESGSIRPALWIDLNS